MSKENHKKFLEFLAQRKINEVNERYNELEGVNVFTEKDSLYEYREWFHVNSELIDIKCCEICDSIEEIMEITLNNERKEVCFHCHNLVMMNQVINRQKSLE